MKRLLAVTLMVTIVTLSGCLSALHPLFTEKDLEFDPHLVGAWLNENGDQVYTFQRGTPESFAELPAGIQSLAGKAYVLTISGKGSKEETGKYYVFRTRIGQHLYLDYFPAQTPAQKAYAAFYKESFLPLHSFFRLKPGAHARVMTLSQFSDSYLQGLINKKEIRIRHEKKRDGDILVTAPTEELQQYVLKYGDVQEAYQDNNTLTKIR